MGGVINRIADNWRPLFAIADVIGSDWPQRIRDAAAALSPRDPDSTATTLLADIRAVFDDKAADRLASADLCEALAAMEGRPWAEWKSGKSVTANQLARQLKPFGIAPTGTVRVGSRTAKGYYRRQFEEAWERYLSAEGVDELSQRHNDAAAGTSTTFQNVTSESGVTVQKCEKSNDEGHCDGVTFQKGDTQAMTPVDTTRRCAQCNGDDDGNLQAHSDCGELHWLHPECVRFWRAKSIALRDSHARAKEM